QSTKCHAPAVCPLARLKYMDKPSSKQVYPAGTLQVMLNRCGPPVNDGHKRDIKRSKDLNQGCITASPRFSPLVVEHQQRLNAVGAAIFGGESILGRVVLLHEKKDDLGLGTDRRGELGQFAKLLACVIVHLKNKL
uniref:Superoxide dismutase copper/zinc binding domain-containing protein n=1 Tax=Electrophorus electricus TaxID=8005 RepID=A0A4W4ENY9_ELEEL